MDPVALARRILGACGYLDTYRQRPRLRLEDLLAGYGLEWHRRPLGEVSGILLAVEDSWHIVTNCRERSARQRFSAAHELKHFLTDRRLATIFTCSRHRDSRLERAANVFARELLMPAEVVRYLVQDRGVRNPAALGRVLGVSMAAAGLRMAELGLGEQPTIWRWVHGHGPPGEAR